ncbi:MAG TPA: thermonuclease family protein [Candidatus Tripitaka sp. YC43]
MSKMTRNLIGWIVLFVLATPLPVFGQAAQVPPADLSQLTQSIAAQLKSETAETTAPAQELSLEKRGELTPPPFFDADSFMIDRHPEVSFQVSKVISGNTIILDNGEVVRLLGVEIPEEFGVEAYRTLKGLLEGKEVNLEFERKNRNMQGQLLAYVLKDGVSVNKLLKEKAFYYSEVDPSLAYTSSFLDKIIPKKDVPMDSWEVIFGEVKPSVMKARIVLKNKQTLHGEFVKETKDYIILKRPFFGKDIIKKKDIAQLGFE